MNKTQSELDIFRTPTPKSRSVSVTPIVERGFTLIELLVVISIIALLSTVVLAAVSDARAKGRNAAKNEYSRQAINALELYRSSNSSYPNFGSNSAMINTSNYACVGYASGETCFGAYSIDGDTSLNSALATYFGGTTPKHESPLVASGAWGDLKGLVYGCQTSTCTSFVVRWHLEGLNRSCLSGATASNVGGMTQCVYTAN